MSLNNHLAILFLLFCSRGFAQPIVLFPDQTPPVTVNSQLLKSAWAGGLNSPMVNQIDLNGDGILDLFLFDRVNDRLTTFINDGIQGQPSYHFEGEYLKKFPRMTRWVRAVDFDCDGDLDLFTYGNKAIAVYRNDFTVGTGLTFTLVTNNLTSWFGTFFSDINASDTNIPAILDMENDGDVDVLTFSNSNNTVEFHRNYFTDSSATSSCDGFNFYYQPYCWGDFQLDGLANIADLNVVCRGNITEENQAESITGSRHSGSILIGYDQDCDGDIDLLNGDILGSNMLYLDNGGTSTLAHVTSQDSLFPSYDVSLNLFNLPSPAYLDVNNDGLKDFIATPGANSGEDFYNVIYYKNTTDNCSNVFNYQSNRLLVEDMIDVGTGCNVSFTDVDNDGLTDIVAGNDLYYNTNASNAVSRLALFQNTGTISQPAFTLISDDWLGLSSLQLNGLYPTFGDLDGDNDLDLLLGCSSGELILYENTAGPGVPGNFVFTQAPYQGIIAGNNAVPQIIDVDRDGKVDLLVGLRNGKIKYYRNTAASVSTPVFSLISSFLGGVNVTKANAGAGLSVPLLYDINGTYEMLVGSESGFIYQYGNIDGNLSGNFTLIDSVYQKILEPRMVTIARTDIDGDSKMDLLTGNNSGGMRLYTQSVTSGIDESSVAPVEIQIMPNPVTDLLTIMQPFSGKNCLAEVVDILGATILTKHYSGSITQMDLSHLSKGLYFIRVNIDGSYFVKKVIRQ